MRKNFTIEEFGAKLPQLLKQQNFDAPLVITEDAQPVALLLPIPKGSVPPSGPIVVVVEPWGTRVTWTETPAPQPVFGSCKGLLKILSEDDEHLADFAEYLK